jgi:tetratricopeptide (TPR) repeat protein
LVHGFQHWTQWFSRSLFATRLDATAQAGGAQYFRPLVLFSFATDHWLGGTNPAIGHATNLLLYAACILGAYATLLRWHAASVGTFFALVWFALQPTHVECAAWISGRTDLLALLGILLATHGVSRRLAHRPGFVVFEIAGTLIAYGSKEIALVLPAFYAVEAWLALERPPLGHAAVLTIVRRSLPQLLLSGLYLGARTLWLPFWTAIGTTNSSPPILSRIGMLLETCGRATALTLWPWPLRGQHGLVSLSASLRMQFVPVYVALGALSILVLLGTLVGLRRCRPSTTMAVFLAAFCFAPTSNLAPSRLQCFLFERYLFIPHLAVAWILAQALDEGFHRCVGKRFARLGFAFSSLILGAFAWLFHQRALDYSDNERFWKHELRYNPKSSVAASSLADLPQNRKSPLKVVRLLSRCYDNATARRQSADADGCLFRALVVMGQNTPDNQVKTLRAIAEELRLLLTGESNSKQRSALQTPLGEFRLAFDAAQIDRLTKSQPGLIEAQLATLMSRLDEPELARKYAEQSLSRCSGCTWSASLALVYANFGDYAKARRILDDVREQAGDLEATPIEMRIHESEAANRTTQTATGPALIHARAQRLLALTRYGQAYAVLVPEKDQFMGIPEVAIGFAQIAYFAGYETEATSVLAVHLTADQVTSTLHRWNEELPMFR